VLVCGSGAGGAAAAAGASSAPGGGGSGRGTGGEDGAGGRSEIGLCHATGWNGGGSKRSSTTFGTSTMRPSGVSA